MTQVTSPILKAAQGFSLGSTPAKKISDTSEWSSLHFGNQPKSDPKPKRHWQWPRIAVLALGLTGLTGSSTIIVPAVYKDVKSWFVSSNEQPVPVEGGMVEEADKAENTEKIDAPAKSDEEIGYLEAMLLTYIFMNSINLVRLGRHAPLKRKSIRPSEIYAELHQRGITGKGLRITVVDSGCRPTALLPKERLTVYTSDDLTKPAKYQDSMGHGTAVASLVADACPDAQVTGISVGGVTSTMSEKKSMNAYLKNAETTGVKPTIEGLRESVLAEYLLQLSQAVEKGLADGSQVINISLGDGDAVRVNLENMIARSDRTLDHLKRKQKWLGWMSPARAKRYEAAIEAERDKREPLLILQNQEMTTPYDVSAPWLQPWKQALDKAHEKGVPVLVSSGNAGTQYLERLTTGDNPDALTVMEHPALLLVGSTDEAGEVSIFSEVHNGAAKPFMAANGSGELETVTAWPEFGILSTLLNPVGLIAKKINYTNPSGTSFSDPDAASLFLLMKSAHPALTIAEFKTLVQKLANPVTFSKYHRQAVEMSIKTQHPITRQLVKEFAEVLKKEFNGQILLAEEAALLKSEKSTEASPKAQKKRPRDFMLFGVKWHLSDALEPNDNQRLVNMMRDFLMRWQSEETWKPVQAEIEAQASKAYSNYVGVGTVAGKRLALVEAAEALANPKALPN